MSSETKKSRKAGTILLTAILMLLLLALTSCSWRSKETIVMPESRTVKLKQGEPAPYPGWLLTDSAMAQLLEAAESCQEKTK